MSATADRRRKDREGRRNREESAVKITLIDAGRDKRALPHDKQATRGGNSPRGAAHRGNRKGNGEVGKKVPQRAWGVVSKSPFTRSSLQIRRQEGERFGIDTSKEVKQSKWGEPDEEPNDSPVVKKKSERANYAERKKISSKPAEQYQVYEGGHQEVTEP